MMQEAATKNKVDFLENVSQDDAVTQHQEHLPLWQSLKRWPKVVGYNLALSSAILLYGYDLVIVGTVSAMPAFQ